MPTPTGRRKFLTSALTATTSALAFGLISPAESQHPRRFQPITEPPFTPESLYDPTTTNPPPDDAADRLALRRLVDAWAHCADRRLAEQQASLFTPDGTILNYEPDTDPAGKPHSTLQGRAAIQKALAVLNTFTHTTHFNGQSDVLIDGDHAIGETYCLAHQLFNRDGQRKLQIYSIRYQDKFLKQDHRWYFAERKLLIDWIDTRTATP